MSKANIVAVAAVAACLVSVLAGCSAAPGPVSQGAASAQAGQASAVAAPEDIQVVESGFVQTGDYWSYAIVAENPNEGLAAEDVRIDIAFKDESGTVLSTESAYLERLLPLQRAAATGYLVTIPGVPAAIEAHASVGDDGWSGADAAEGGAADSLEVSGLAELDGGYGDADFTGEVSNPLGEAVDVRVDVVIRDGSGAAIGGTFAYVDAVPAGGKAAFSATLPYAPAHAAIEAYVLPD